jgi:hypothetical protein
MVLTKEQVKEVIKRNYKKAIVALIILFLVSYLFNTSIKSLIVMAMFIVIGSFSTFYFNYAQPPIHFETVKLGTILTAVAYGVFPGIVVGVVSTFFGKVLIGRIDEKLPLSMATIALVAVGTAIFSTASITTLGIVLVLSYNITMFILSMFLGGDLAWNIPYEASNFIINVLWFTRIAPWLLPLID